MGEATKTIRVSEGLYARIKALSRGGESLAETLDRLLQSPSLQELAGTLSDEEAVEFETAIAESYRHYTGEIQDG